jgi:hypothetical protein
MYQVSPLVFGGLNKSLWTIVVMPPSVLIVTHKKMMMGYAVPNALSPLIIIWIPLVDFFLSLGLNCKV